MASMERCFSFSFRKHEGHMFFIYDHKKKKEEDDPKDAILYFYPRSVKTDDQVALVGGIIGITDFCLEFLPQEMPQIIKLSAHNFALLQHGDYIIGLAGSMDIPANFLIKHMQFLWSTFVFYQGSITALRQRQPEEQFLRKLNMVWDIYLPLCQSQGDLLGQAFQTIPYIKLHRSQGSLFLHASHILQRSLKQNGVIAGALFSKNKVLCTQLSNVLTRKLLLLMMQTQFPSVEVNPKLELPGGVHLIHVYLTQDEYESLNHRRNKRYSSSLHSSLEEPDIAKLSTSPDVKKSIFSDSAISSGGEQFNSHSANMSAEHDPSFIAGQSCGQNNHSSDVNRMSTLVHTEDDSENYTDTTSDHAIQTEAGIQENGDVSCEEVGTKSGTEAISHVDAVDKLKHCDNIEENEKNRNLVESHTNSLKYCNSGTVDEELKSKGNDSSISVSSESNLSMDNLKDEQLHSAAHPSGSLAMNEEKRNSSTDDINNNGHSSSSDNDRNSSPLDKSENSSNCGSRSSKLSSKEESGKSFPDNRSGNVSSNENSGNFSLNEKNRDLSPAHKDRLDESCDKGIEEPGQKNVFPESQHTEEHQGEDIEVIKRKLDLKISNSNFQFSTGKVGNNLKDSQNSGDSASGTGQSNHYFANSGFSQKLSASDVLISSGKNCYFQRHVSLDSPFSHQASVSWDDSSFQSSCEVKKDDDPNTSRKSSVNSLANSDVPSSKDRLTFENLDSENSDFGLVSPDSEFHPMCQGNSLPVNLSSLKESDAQEANCGSFHSCHEGEGGMTIRLVNEAKRSSDSDNKSSNWTPQQENLSEMNLYIQGHSDTLLVLLIEKEITCNKSYIHSLWKSCLSHLGELDFEVKNVERHSKDEAENIGALYQYMKYDSFSNNLSGSATLPVTSLANEMVDSCVRMHKDFIFMPDLMDATYRSHTACSFGRRSLNSETYFQLGIPGRGGVNPAEKTFHLEQMAQKCLVQDHRINLLNVGGWMGASPLGLIPMFAWVYGPTVMSFLLLFTSLSYFFAPISTLPAGGWAGTSPLDHIPMFAWVYGSIVMSFLLLFTRLSYFFGL